MYYLAGLGTGASFKIMNSPVEILIKPLIQINRDLDTPIYLQIANQLIHAIASGKLKPGTKLLGTRQLSETLEIHRNTASAVYNELDAQGWVQIIPNRGTFVASELPELVETKIFKSNYPKTTGFHFQKSILLDSPFEHTTCQLLLNDGSPDIRITQINDLSRYYSANLKRKSNRQKMGYFNQEGSEYFKEQLAHFLHTSRALQASPENLLITRSIEMSLFIISEIILRKNDVVIVAALSYFAANMIFQKSGCQILSIPVDDDGIDTEALRSLCEKRTIRMVYVTPHHHYPTTVSMSAQRRMELLQLAKEYKFVIVEDDHDYDFQYDRAPLLPLATADKDGMVIYVSSFGKSLAPGFRTGFVVAPANLMMEMRKHLGIIDRQGDVLMEQALAEMIEEGAIYRHLKKSVKVYRERRNLAAINLINELGADIDFQIPNGGLAFWLRWKQPLNLLKLSIKAAENDLFIPKTLLYQKKDLTAIRLGFGNLNPDEMAKSIQIIKCAVKSLS